MDLDMKTGRYLYFSFIYLPTNDNKNLSFYFLVDSLVHQCDIILYIHMYLDFSDRLQDFKIIKVLLY